MCVTWLIHVCDMTYSHVWHDAFMSHDVSCPMVAILRCVTWLIHVCDLTHSCVWHDVFMCVTWRIYESWCELPHGGHSEVCDMTHSCVWLWLIHVCDMTHSCVWHDSFMCVTWLIYMCDMIGWQGLPFTSVKPCLKFRGLPWNPAWKLRGIKNLFEILAVVNISSPISSARGSRLMNHSWMIHEPWDEWLMSRTSESQPQGSSYPAHERRNRTWIATNSSFTHS